MKNRIVGMRLLTCVLGLGMTFLANTFDAAARQDPDQQAALKSMSFMLKRAALVRTLAAEHVYYLNLNKDKSNIHLLEDASQVMAYSLVCDDTQLDPTVLNKIATETTLQIALIIDGSPIAERITSLMGDLEPDDRMTLVADVSSAVLMFKIGRRRGLFDAMLADFGTTRFCAGMGANMRDRYNALATHLEDADRPANP